MSKKEISGGVVHKLPDDLREALTSSKGALLAWEDITPLARNEWICWVLSVKKPETRKQHIKRTRTELIEGKRRPCCWGGCIHRWLAIFYTFCYKLSLNTLVLWRDGCMKFLLAFSIVMTIFLQKEPYPGQGSHAEPPANWFCSSNAKDKAHVCHCKRMIHANVDDPVCEFQQPVEDKDCTVYCHPKHCHCEVSCVKWRFTMSSTHRKSPMRWYSSGFCIKWKPPRGPERSSGREVRIHGHRFGRTDVT